MNLINIPRAKYLIAEIEKCEGMLAIAKSPDLELVSIDFNYYIMSSTYSEKPKVANKRILSKLHDMFIFKLEQEIAELKTELATL